MGSIELLGERMELKEGARDRRSGKEWERRERWEDKEGKARHVWLHPHFKRFSGVACIKNLCMS